MPNFYDKFGGVKIDYDLLYNLDNSQLSQLSAYLNQKGLSVIVDFSSGIDHTINLTLEDQVHEDYVRSKAIIDNVLAKMQTLGLVTAIVCTEQPPETNLRNPDTGIAAPWGDTATNASYKRPVQVAALRDIAQRAAAKNINIHVQNSPMDRKFGSIYDVKSIVDEINMPNLKVAANANYNSSLSSLLSASSTKTGAIILGSPTGPSNGIRPFYLSGQSAAPLTSYNVPRILDGGYADWNAITAEYNYLGSNLPLPTQPNINGTFETGSAGPWVGYTTVSAAAKLNGSYGMLITGPSLGISNIGRFVEVHLTNLLPETTYTVTANVKAVSGTGFLYVKEYGGADVTRSLTNDGQWHSYTLTFKTGSAGNAKIGFMRIPDNGDVYLDDVSIQ